MTAIPGPQRRPRVYYGWIIVAVVGLGGFTQSAETFPVLSVFLKPITEEFGWSRTIFAGSTTIGTLLGAVVAIGMGRIIDRFGARWSLAISFAGLGTTLVLMAFVTTLWHFYALQILSRALAMGVIAFAMVVIIPKWFVAKRGRAVAIGGLGTKLGNTVTPLYVQLLVGLWGWRAASAATGIVVWVVSLLPAAIFLRRQPEDMGLLPDGATPEEVASRQPTSPGAAGPQARRLDVSLPFRQVVRLPSFYLLVSAFSLSFFVAPGLALHMIPYLTDQGIGPGMAAIVLAVRSASSALGALLLGFLAERYVIRVLMAIDLLFFAGGFVALLMIHSTSLALLWGFYQGVAQGGMMALQHIIFADYYGRDSLGALGSVFWPVQLVANSMGPLSASLAYDITGSYSLIFTIFSAFALLASLLVLMAKPPVLVPPPIASGTEQSDAGSATG